MICNVVHIWADIIRKKIFQMDSKRKFELIKFDSDNMWKRVLTDDNIKENGKERYSKLLMALGSWQLDTFIYDVKDKRMSGTSWYQQNSMFSIVCALTLQCQHQIIKAGLKSKESRITARKALISKMQLKAVALFKSLIDCAFC